MIARTAVHRRKRPLLVISFSLHDEGFILIDPLQSEYHAGRLQSIGERAVKKM
jgi:hypothetical protein